MSTVYTSETRKPEAELDQFAPSPILAPAPLAAPPPKSGVVSSQALFGNAAVVNAETTSAPIAPTSEPSQLQSAFGNSVVSRANEARQATAGSFEPIRPEKPQTYSPPESKPESTE